MDPAEDARERASIAEWGRQCSARDARGRGDPIDGAVTLLGGLIKLALVVIAVKWLFFT